MGKADKQVIDAKIEAGVKAERKAELKKRRKELKAKGDSFFGDFKKFITRGNVLDMAVGVIVGGAFTGIINALSNNILKPVINFLLALILGSDSLSDIYTFLKRVDTVDEAGNTIPDLTQSIYIDWGAFINAIINFMLIAFTLFVIVRIIKNVRAHLEAKEREEAEAAAAKAKAEADAKAAKEKEEAAAKAAALAAEEQKKADALAQFYANVERQTKLLEEIAKK